MSSILPPLRLIDPPMLGVSMITRGLAASTSLTVLETAAAGPPGGEAVVGSAAPGELSAVEGAASLCGAELLACICAWCSRWYRGPA